MKKHKSEFQRFAEMNLEELRRATAEFDEEVPEERFGPLTPERRKRWQRAKRKPGRPQVGRGVKVISVSVEKGLLARSDALARKLKVRRSNLIARGLRAVLVAEGKHTGLEAFGSRQRTRRTQR